MQDPSSALSVHPCSKARCLPADEDILAGIKNHILEEERAFLCRYLIPSRHYPYLRSVHILSEDDCCEIDHQITNRQKANYFIDLLKKKGPKAFDHLCEALLQERTQMFLLQRLNKNYEGKKIHFNALCNKSREKSYISVLEVGTVDDLPSSMRKKVPVMESQGGDS